MGQTMSRGEAFGLENYIKNNPLEAFCQILNILMKNEFGLSTKFGSSKMLDPNFAREAELLAP